MNVKAAAIATAVTVGPVAVIVLAAFHPLIALALICAGVIAAAWVSIYRAELPPGWLASALRDSDGRPGGPE